MHHCPNAVTSATARTAAFCVRNPTLQGGAFRNERRSGLESYSWINLTIDRATGLPRVLTTLVFAYAKRCLRGVTGRNGWASLYPCTADLLKPIEPLCGFGFTAWAGSWPVHLVQFLKSRSRLCARSMPRLNHRNRRSIWMCGAGTWMRSHRAFATTSLRTINNTKKDSLFGSLSKIQSEA